MRLSIRIKNMLTAVLIALLAVSYVSSTMCWHTHRIGDWVIVHSHLFGRSAAAQGTDGGHTPGQLLMIQEANEQVFTDGSVMPELLPVRIDVLTDLFSAPAVLPVQGRQPAVRSLRAPPGL